MISGNELLLPRIRRCGHSQPLSIRKMLPLRSTAVKNETTMSANDSYIGQTDMLRNFAPLTHDSFCNALVQLTQSQVS